MSVSIYSRHHGLPLVEVAGRLSIGQRLVTKSDPFSDSLFHVLIAGETLDMLAKKYFGSEDLWWRIADANSAQFPYEWKPGDVVVIPPIRVATRTPRR